MTPAEVCDRAADLLEERGWCQGRRGIGGMHCALGALFLAATGDPYPDDEEIPSVQRAWRECDAACGDRMPLVEWNDQPGRTKEEVISLLRATAERLRGEAR